VTLKSNQAVGNKGPDGATGGDGSAAAGGGIYVAQGIFSCPNEYGKKTSC
jgi:hypothetical protein